MTNEEWMKEAERLIDAIPDAARKDGILRQTRLLPEARAALLAHLSARPLPQATLSETLSDEKIKSLAIQHGAFNAGDSRGLILWEHAGFNAGGLFGFARAVLAAARQVPVPPKIAAIIERLHTQDNRITANPLFAVQQKRRIYGLGSDYRDGTVFVDDEGIEFDERESVENGCREVGYRDTWEFVTGCLTEQGCKDYITANGHNLREPRIYAYGSYRNAEFIALREWLMGLASPSPVGQEEPGHKCGEGVGIVGVGEGS